MQSINEREELISSVLQKSIAGGYSENWCRMCGCSDVGCSEPPSCTCMG